MHKPTQQYVPTPKELEDFQTKINKLRKAMTLNDQADILNVVYMNWWDTPQLTTDDRATFIDENLVMLPLKLRKEAAKLKENA